MVNKKNAFLMIANITKLNNHSSTSQRLSNVLPDYLWIDLEAFYLSFATDPFAKKNVEDDMILFGRLPSTLAPELI